MSKNNSVSLKATPEIKTPVTEVEMIASKFSGPIPPPDAFEEYDRTLPGAANRILTLAEGEALHRRKLEADKLAASIDIENKLLSHNFRLARVGQVFAFVLGITGLSGAIYCASIGQQVAASAIAAGGLAALIAPFLKEWKSEKK